ncbi:helix-turn-helix domain-containing protein [Verrucomicrobiaceae bacterium 227]
MPAKLYRIKLASDERIALEEIRDKGTQNARKFKRVLALLLSDEAPDGPAKKDAEIVTTTGLSSTSLERLRKRCCEVGPLAALDPKPRESGPREIKITGEVEAHITRLACAQPPEGRTRWTLSLIAEKLIEIEVISEISRTAVATVLKKANLNLGVKKDGAFPPKKTPPS